MPSRNGRINRSVSAGSGAAPDAFSVIDGRAATVSDPRHILSSSGGGLPPSSSGWYWPTCASVGDRRWAGAAPRPSNVLAVVPPCMLSVLPMSPPPPRCTRVRITSRIGRASSSDRAEGALPAEPLLSLAGAAGEAFGEAGDSDSPASSPHSRMLLHWGQRPPRRRKLPAADKSAS